MDNTDVLNFIQQYLKSSNDERFGFVRRSAVSEPYLYRYRPMTYDYDFDALFNNKFWLQSLNNQNDEIEGLEFLSSSDILKLKSAHSVPKYIKNHEIAKFNRIMKNELKIIRTNLGVVCFSEEQNNKIMWEKYADNYCGLCIEYNKVDFTNKNMHIIPVYYKEKRLVGDFFEFVSDGKLLKLKSNENFPPEISLAYKTLKWEYEKEWRHIEYIEKQTPYKNDILKPILNLSLNENNIAVKATEIQALKNDFMNNIPTPNMVGKLIDGIKPNRIFIGHRMIDDNKHRIINFCKLNSILYDEF